MAEMTAEKVKTLLESFAALCGSNAKAKELCGDAIKFVEQQAAEIERLNQTWPNSCDFKDDDGCCLFPGAMTPECHADVCGVIRDLKQEVVRKNRVIYVACQRLARRSDGYYGVENWLAWLEKEAEVHE